MDPLVRQLRHVTLAFLQLALSEPKRVRRFDFNPTSYDSVPALLPGHDRPDVLEVVKEESLDRAPARGALRPLHAHARRLDLLLRDLTQVLGVDRRAELLRLGQSDLLATSASDEKK